MNKDTCIRIFIHGSIVRKNRNEFSINKQWPNEKFLMEYYIIMKMNELLPQISWL